MSAPVRIDTTHRASGSVSASNHRFAGAIVVGVDDVVVLGVRHDDEDHRVGDSLLLRLQPGRVDVVASLPWPAKAISALVDGRFLVVDGADSLHVVDSHAGPVLLRSGVRALRDGVVLGHDGDVARAVCDAGVVVLVPCGHVDGGAVIGTSTTPGTILIGARNGSVVELGEAGEERWRAAPADASSFKDPVDAVALVDGVVAIAAGCCLQVGPRRYVLKRPASSLAQWQGQWFVGSTAGGLSVVDDDEPVVRTLRPSLRAHQLLVADDGLVIVSDLFVATSTDGLDFFSRDLSAFVRLAAR